MQSVAAKVESVYMALQWMSDSSQPKAHEIVIFLAIAWVAVAVLVAIVTSAFKTLYRLSLSPEKLAQECLKFDGLISAEYSMISSVSDRIKNATSGAEALGAYQDEINAEEKIKKLQEEKEWYKCSDVKPSVESSVAGSVSSTKDFCKLVIDVISPAHKDCGRYYDQLKSEIAHEVAAKRKCTDAQIRLSQAKSRLESARNRHHDISRMLEDAQSFRYDPPKLLDDYDASKLSDDIASAEAEERSVCGAPAVSSGLDKSEELERQARDEIERFGRWSGEGPAPQPIKAMEKLWRCNKYGDC